MTKASRAVSAPGFFLWLLAVALLDVRHQNEESGADAPRLACFSFFGCNENQNNSLTELVYPDTFARNTRARFARSLRIETCS